MIFQTWNFILGYVASKLRSEKGEFGIGSLIGVAIGLIVAGFVLIPGMRNFASVVMADMNAWWSNVVSKNVFPN